MIFKASLKPSATELSAFPMRCLIHFGQSLIFSSVGSVYTWPEQSNL